MSDFQERPEDGLRVEVWTNDGHCNDGRTERAFALRQNGILLWSRYGTFFYPWTSVKRVKIL